MDKHDSLLQRFFGSLHDCGVQRCIRVIEIDHRVFDTDPE